MKLTITNGTVVVESESKKEASELFNRYFDTASPNGVVSLVVTDAGSPKKHKPHKKHLFTKRCRYCNRGCKGGTGLSSHERSCVKKQTSESLSRIPTGLLN